MGTMSSAAPIPGSPAAAAPAPPALPAPGWWLPAASLWRRELVRFFRQPNRVVGAFATPVVFWVLLGSGLSRSFTPVAAGGAAAGVSYLEYFFPGTAVLILLFTAIFSTISVIEDRREGFLQGVLVAPIPRLSLVIGKVLGGATIATLQGALFLLLWPAVGHWHGWTAEAGALLGGLAVMFVLALGLTALGLCIAWPMDSTAGFHAIMNLFLTPMWFLSGAVFPVSSAPGWLQAVMLANPLTYGQAALAAVLTGGRAGAPTAPVSTPAALAVLAGFAAGVVVLAGWLISRPRKDGLA